VFRLRGLGRRGATARFSQRQHSRGVKTCRLDRHLELKKLDTQDSLRVSMRPKKRALRCQFGAKRPTLLRRGTIRVVPVNMAG